MANTHETIADIRKDAEAKFRELVKAYMQRRAAFQTTVGAMQAFNTVFDRIDAAIKRERAKIEADALEVGGIVEAAHKRELSKNVSKNGADFGQLGDCAKLREALENMVRAETYGSMERDDLCGRCLEKMFARCNHDGTCWVDKAITALSAPPRNCDRFASAEEAIEYHKRTNCAERRYCAYHDGCPTDGSCVVNWLYAEAQEGGAK